MNRLLTAMLLFGISLQAGAADIYRWVDAQGRTHVSDSVPAEYRERAQRLDSSSSAVSPGDAAAARERAERDRQRLQQAGARRTETEATSASTEMNAGSLKPQGESECAALWREYRKSQECFAPFMIAGRNGVTGHVSGHVREEAFLHCKSLPDPTAKCGAAPN